MKKFSIVILFLLSIIVLCSSRSLIKGSTSSEIPKDMNFVKESSSPEILTGLNFLKESMPLERPKDFNFIVAYGFMAKNKIDTFKGAYTKDLVIDGVATCKITFTDEEIDKIYAEMQKINIIKYPRYFEPPYQDNPDPNMTVHLSHYSTYYFKIQTDNKIKEINWVNKNGSEATSAKQLKSLIRVIMEIVESKEEYKKLPEAKGGYI